MITNEELNEIMKNKFLDNGWNIIMPFVDGTFMTILNWLRRYVHEGYRFQPKVTHTFDSLLSMHFDDLKAVVFKHKKVFLKNMDIDIPDVAVVYLPPSIPLAATLADEFNDIWEPFMKYIIEELHTAGKIIIEDGGDDIKYDKVLTTNYPFCTEYTWCIGTERRKFIRNSKMVWNKILDDLSRTR